MKKYLLAVLLLTLHLSVVTMSETIKFKELSQLGSLRPGVVELWESGKHQEAAQRLALSKILRGMDINCLQPAATDRYGNRADQVKSEPDFQALVGPNYHKTDPLDAATMVQQISTEQFKQIFKGQVTAVDQALKDKQLPDPHWILYSRTFNLSPMDYNALEFRHVLKDYFMPREQWPAIRKAALNEYKKNLGMPIVDPQNRAMSIANPLRNCVMQ